jgi:hypothetical protein
MEFTRKRNILSYVKDKIRFGKTKGPKLASKTLSLKR